MYTEKKVKANETFHITEIFSKFPTTMNEFNN